MGSNKGKVRASHILVAKHKQALQILDELDAGVKFAELARKHSECPSRKKGGDLGFFCRGQMVKEFERTVYSMNVGDISDPVKTKFGYHIIKRTA
ncbi:peptidylprolyl isomerase [Candidatus Bathyarchaeota archaeon]|nr:peptidylprolyl isomerase [Candidatus Bathyarchaeota archaeon]